MDRVRSERGVGKTSSNTVANKGGEPSRAEGVQPIAEGDGERGVDKTSSNTVANEGGEPSRAEGVQPIVEAAKWDCFRHLERN